MKTLIVPDIHERTWALTALEPKIETADRVVFLGDWFDTYQPKGLQGWVADWVLERLHDDKFTFLWGNHDTSYAFKHPDFNCSGYNPATKAILDHKFGKEDWQRFKVWTEVGPFVVSHAGFRPETVQFMNQTETAIEEALAGKFHPLWEAGWTVGGTAEWGGPTWLRWWEMLPQGLEEGGTAFPQVVGHTIGETVRQEGNNICLDTNNKHFMWVEKVDEGWHWKVEEL